MYTVKQVASYIGISGNTIRSQWGKEFADYLSPSANPPKGHKRLYTEDDISIFQTIAVLREQHASYEDIHTALADGVQLEPETGSQKPLKFRQKEEPRQEEPQALVTKLTATVARFEGELTAVKDERDRLRDEVGQLHDKLGETKERATAAETEAAILRAQLDEMSQAAAGEQQARRWWQFWKD